MAMDMGMDMDLVTGMGMLTVMVTDMVIILKTGKQRKNPY
jgi:hypothetical protein